MHITILCHYFWPELGAPSARLKEMADVWLKEGHAVSILTNYPNHPTGLIQDGYKNGPPSIEIKDGLRIVRLTTFATPNRGFIKKTLGHLVYMWNAIFQGRQFVRETDVFVASSPTLFTVVSAWWLGRKLKKPFVFEVRDLWPAIFVELGTIRNRFAIRLLEMLELFLYRKSAKVVTVTRAFGADIARRGIPEKKIAFIPNGADTTRFTPGPSDEALRRTLNLEGKFLVLYIGAHGISQGLPKVLEAAERLASHLDIHFLFVGEGADKEKMETLCRERHLKNVTLLPGCAKDQVLRYYRSADLCLVPLRNIPLFKTFIPSKMFEILSAGRPILASLEGEAAEILTASGAAVVVPPENPEALAEAVLHLASAPKQREKMAKAGPPFVAEHFCREKLAREYLTILREISG